MSVAEVHCVVPTLLPVAAMREFPIPVAAALFIVEFTPRRLPLSFWRIPDVRPNHSLADIALAIFLGALVAWSFMTFR